LALGSGTEPWKVGIANSKRREMGKKNEFQRKLEIVGKKDELDCEIFVGELSERTI
jgi:hypothetical protein